MMLAQLKPSPSTTAGAHAAAVAANTPGADAAAAAVSSAAADGAAAPAAGEAAAPATQAATPFSSWLMIDAQAAQPVAHDGAAAAAEGQDGLLELAVPADGAAQPVAQDVAAMPAMTMMLTLPPGAALPLPPAMPVGLAAPVDAAVNAATTTITTAAAAPQAVGAVAVPLGLAAPAAGNAERDADRSASPSAALAAPIQLPGVSAAAVALPAAAHAAPATPYAAMRAADATLAAPAAQKTTLAGATVNPAPTTGIDTVARGDATLAAPASLLGGANALAPQATSQAAPTDLKLAGNPDNWQQPLRDALGDRLQLQLGRNIDQAVIRLDPPQLGRIEIAIRHAGGALEVTISATHSEVRRQLNTISDSMRSDLAQRQFSDVAVTITAAPRSGNAAFADQQGRGRQPEQDHDEANVGRALAEAGNPAATFSLFGREYTA